MKKHFILSILLFIYILLYKLYFIYYGEIVTYIINPLVWVIISLFCHFNLSFKKGQDRYSTNISSIIIIMSLIYIICYYGLGLIVGYTNNPFSTNISGIVVNSFSLWFVVCLKEYVRYIFIHAKIRKHKRPYYIFLFVIFLISDISLINVIESTDILDLWAKELLVPMILNIFMIYLSYVSNYKSAVISRSIILLPTLVFNVAPNYDWFAIVLFNLFYCFFSYLIIQYLINKKESNIPVRLVDSFNPKKWIVGTILIIIAVSFGTGLFNVKPTAILSGSMEPNIKTGDMVIVMRCNINDISIDDIIEFKTENFNVVHRVIKIINNDSGKGLITKGDANKEEDHFIVRSNQIVGKVIFTVPYIGYPTYYIRKLVNNSGDIDIEQGGS